MSALKELSKTLNESPWPFFKQTFPVKVRQVDKGFLMINQALKEDILEEGDCLQRRSAAKCLMTRWNMHEDYESFRMIGNTAIRLANDFPLAKRSKQDGSSDPISLYIKETWGLIYNTGDSTAVHNHWPTVWRFVYYVKACEKCAPLVFDDCPIQDPWYAPLSTQAYCVEACDSCSPLQFPTCEEKLEIVPRTGQMILWPAWLLHEVPKHTCEHDRIMLSGNVNMK